MPGKPVIEYNVDPQSRRGERNQTITTTDLPTSTPSYFMPTFILGTSKLGQAILGTSPMVLGYGRLGLSTLFTNPGSR